MSTSKVLFVGDSKTLPVCVTGPLTRWGVPIQTSGSLAEALPLVKRTRFRMVLTRLRVADGSAVEFIPHLAGQPTDLFSYLHTTEGFLWLPLVISGQECVSVRPLQTAAFLRLAGKRLKGAASSDGGKTVPDGLPSPNPFELLAEHEP